MDKKTLIILESHPKKSDSSIDHVGDGSSHDNVEVAYNVVGVMHGQVEAGVAKYDASETTKQE